jgi:predicted nuclease of predicted toxin-antitoxin system
MKFIIDAQLPSGLANWLSEKGHPSIHTLSLPSKNKSTDLEILEVALTEERIVVSKDSDFYESFILNQKPKKLLLISTGNISNSELQDLLERNLSKIINLFNAHSLIEVDQKDIIVHK